MTDILKEKKITAIEALWRAVLSIEVEFGGLTGLHNILTAEELSRTVFAKPVGVSGPLDDYRDIITWASKLQTDEWRPYRLFCSPSLWARFETLQRAYGRLAALANQSFDQKKNKDWYEDKLMKEILENVPAAMLEGAKQRPIGGINAVLAHLREEFFAEATKSLESN